MDQKREERVKGPSEESMREHVAYGKVISSLNSIKDERVRNMTA